MYASKMPQRFVRQFHDAKNFTELTKFFFHRLAFFPSAMGRLDENA